MAASGSEVFSGRAPSSSLALTDSHRPHPDTLSGTGPDVSPVRPKKHLQVCLLSPESLRGRTQHLWTPGPLPPGRPPPSKDREGPSPEEAPSLCL